MSSIDTEEEIEGLRTFPADLYAAGAHTDTARSLTAPCITPVLRGREHSARDHDPAQHFKGQSGYVRQGRMPRPETSEMKWRLVPSKLTLSEAHNLMTHT